MKQILIFIIFILSFSLYAQNDAGTDREALIALYNATNGENWKYKWNLSDQVDEWYGVTTNSEGRVIKLLLGFNNYLDGELPEELGDLDMLTDMVIYGNPNLVGSIPAEIGSLNNIKFINLSRNKLVGSLPEEIGQLTNLIRLYLNQNNLSGQIPEGISTMASLTELNLSNNDFTGELPNSFSLLPSIYDLNLGYNDFTGEIPQTFDQLNTLGILNLTNNNLEGNFLLQLSSLNNLRELNLTQNQLSGELDNSIGNMTGLRILRLGGNSFSGTLPIELGLLSNLNYLNLYGNGFHGELPAEIGNLSSLQRLYLSENNFHGNLPAELSQLNILREFSVAKNNFEGGFPITLTTLSNLEVLYVNDNRFQGSIPEEVINLRDLRRVSLNGNLFVGDVPLFYENIEYIDISENVFSQENMENILTNQDNTNVYYYGPVNIIHEPQKEYLYDTNEIKGNVRFDILNNGCSQNDTGVQYLKMLLKSENDSIITFTSEDGFYRYRVDEGQYQTSVVHDLPDYFNVSPNFQETTFTDTGKQIDASFCISSEQNISDLNISFIPIREARAGFNTTYALIINNAGTLAKNINVQLNFNQLLTFLEASESPSVQNLNSLEFEFENFKALETKKITIKFDIPPPPTVNLNDVLNFTATVNPLTGDFTEEDNTFTLEQTIIGSYDPNDITVLEGEEVHIDNVEAYLNYVIRFQNTGTASAINVRIDHELDADLDWETFTPLSSSHGNTTTITDGKYVEFLFENIQLPDSTSNEPESHGYIAFKIKPKSNVAVGDLIDGQASIYFDFNPPIFTNTVNTEFVDESELLSSTAEIINLISCPSANDAIIEVVANGGAEPYLYELWDENSNPLIISQPNNTFGDFGPGNYITKVIDNNGEESFFNITILEALTIETTFEVTDASCFGANNGQIEVFATNGNAPYQYRINGGDLQQSNLFENLIPNQYVIETIDMNGCSVISETLTITEPIVLMANTTVTDISCKGLNDGNISINAMGGTLPHEYSVDGTTFLLSNEFNDIAPGNYTVWCRDFNGCVVSNEVVISEPNSPDFDNDGIGDQCDDDIDGDGVTNNLDNCTETPLGTDIDNSGCVKFSLPNTNFSIQVVGETCASSNNGSILVTAMENLDYTATLNYVSTTIDKDFRTFVAFQDLEAGAYNICITVSGESNFEQCFNINISQPEPLDIDAKVDNTGKSITLKMKGGENYTISINDVIYQTTSEEIILPLSDTQNNVQIKTDKDCQGIYDEMFLIDVSEILIFPNPVVGNEVSVQIPHSFDENIHLTLYANDGRMVAKMIEKNNGDPIKINVSGLTSGIYNLNIEIGNNSESRRIIIK
ncbi:T9SS type A sorting domain-containing protein [uncultured Maribacter sp.]|uniref:DUF7619 domain-containing protein n=1 Tax=uncultured Maribacter sp. TaxID=431308 RepID=UPI00261A2E3F|nr:T9SS type A sorting domain-containing protein [uncultured Maribacter sp.]